MAKKSKEKRNQSQAQQQETNETSNSSDIFSTLFGATQADPNIASLFSDNNPFKRKQDDNPPPTQEPKLGVLDDGVSQNNDSDNVEVKKSKKKGKNVILNSESVAEEVISDSGSKKKGKNIILGSEYASKEANGEASDTKMVTLATESNKEKKKKRKRDEIEAEYEAKRYGVVAAVEKVEKGIAEKVVGEKRKKMDNPEDTMVSKEGFDDESKLLRTVFVGNLPLKIKKKVLLKEFGSFGEVESVRIRSIPVADSATPRKAAIIKKKLNDNADSVHAYVVFKSEESAQASLAHNMAMVEGRHIRVDRACPPRKKMKGDNDGLYDNKRTVFVGNLPFDVKDEEIYLLFSGIKELESSVEAVRVIRDPNTLLGKGIAYVLFKTREAANFVSRKRNLKLRDRELRVSHAKANATPSHAKANSTPSKRKSLSTEDRFSSPAKKFAVDSGGSYKGKAKAAGSYQGMKASKSGVQKKTQSRISNRGASKPQTQMSQKPSDRKSKRPSVAARKAKELKAASSGLKQTGTKRKMDNRTPVSASRNKKFRKS